MAKELQLSKVVVDAGTQSRAQLEPERVAEYAEIYQEGGNLPPLEAYTDGETFWLTDGFHRFEAAITAGLGMLPFVVKKGSLDVARWASYSANKSHGLNRTNADKRYAVEQALKHPHSRGLSDRAIAEHVGVSHNFVTTLRKQLSSDDSSEQPAKRLGKDGKERRLPQKPTTPVEPPNPPSPRVPAAKVEPVVTHAAVAVAEQDESEFDDEAERERLFETVYELARRWPMEKRGELSHWLTQLSDEVKYDV